MRTHVRFSGSGVHFRDDVAPQIDDASTQVLCALKPMLRREDFVNRPSPNWTSILASVANCCQLIQLAGNSRNAETRQAEIQRYAQSLTLPFGGTARASGLCEANTARHTLTEVIQESDSRKWPLSALQTGSTCRTRMKT
jgi:hypothetical protein